MLPPRVSLAAQHTRRLQHPMFQNKQILLPVIGNLCRLLHNLVESLKRHAPEPSGRTEAQHINGHVRSEMMLRLPETVILVDLQRTVCTVSRATRVQCEECAAIVSSQQSGPAIRL